MGYRADIDGLRAVAVLAVVFFHAGIAPFSGGYVGVDVFFVISGFLITGVIVSAGRGLSLGHFYERRIRRIFPALFTMLLLVLAAGAVVLLPDDFFDLGNTGIATTFFVANFVFAKETGYFGAAAELSPLLHTWSLAVEEQFYIVYPVLMMVLVRRLTPGRMAGVLWVLLGCSLAYGAWAVTRTPAAAFYLFPGRAWELLLGGVLAVAPMAERLRALPGPVRTAMAVAGAAMVGWSVIFFSDRTVFPGLAALVPCGGAALLIAAGPATPVARALAWRPVVFVGLISYSLYLWHWPLLVLARQMLVTPDLPAATTAVVLGLALVLAGLSWWLVERPFRGGRWRGWPRRRIFGVAGAALASGLVVGLVVTWSDGLPGRLPADVIAVAQARSDVSADGRRCLSLPFKVGDTDIGCDIGVVDADASFLLWGDSHAGALLPGIDAAARTAGRGGRFAGRSACPPLVGVDGPRAFAGDCRDFNDAVLAQITADPSVRTVVLAARWAIWAEGTRYGQETGPALPLSDDDSGADQSGGNRGVFARGVTRTIEQLRTAGKDVVIIGPVPEAGHDVPITLAKALLGTPDPAFSAAPPVAAFADRQAFVMETLTLLAAQTGVRIIWPHEVLCGGDRCAVEVDGRPLYSDDDHLTASAALDLAPLFSAIFE